jgi:dihydroflavonol-4-reductase
MSAATREDRRANGGEIDPAPKGTYYERSKQKADKLVAESGLDVVFLHPSAVYGTAPSDSPGVNELMIKLANNKAPGLLPGGFPVVFASDCGEGHVRAMEQGKPGARYILSERYYTLKEIAVHMLAALGIDRKPPRVLPKWVCSMVASLGAARAAIAGGPPLIPKGQLAFLQVDSYPTAKRAETELGMTFTKLDDGLAKTVAYLRERGQLPALKQLTSPA